MKRRLELELVAAIARKGGYRGLRRDEWRVLNRSLRACARAGCPDSMFWADMVFAPDSYYSWVCLDRGRRHLDARIKYSWDGMPF